MPVRFRIEPDVDITDQSEAEWKKMLAIHLDPETEERLDRLAKLTGRTKTFHAQEAIVEHLEDLEDILLAKERLANTGERTVLFLDEIHRFNRAQQDILLPDVEAGFVLLVGATTENPFFAVNSYSPSYVS